MSEQRMRRVYFYAIGERREVVRYDCLYQDEISISRIRLTARMLAENYEGVKRVFVIDNSSEVFHTCRAAMTKQTPEALITFLDLLEREGMEILDLR